MTTLSKLSETSNKNSGINTIGQIILGITGATAIILTTICVPFLSPALRKYCLPYVPATEIQIKNIVSSLRYRSGNLIDLGSGDGRIVIEAAKRNFVAHGVELNPWLVVYSRIDSFRKGVASRTKFFRKDLWKFQLTPYNNVVIFGVEQMMSHLEEKIIAECRNECNIIACRFPLPNLQPECTIGSGIDTVWVYKINNTNL